jgi:hypothetical protein
MHRVKPRPIPKKDNFPFRKANMNLPNLFFQITQTDTHSKYPRWRRNTSIDLIIPNLPVGKKKIYIKLVHSAWFRAVTKRCEFYDVTKSLGFNQKKTKKKHNRKLC